MWCGGRSLNDLEVVVSKVVRVWKMYEAGWKGKNSRSLVRPWQIMPSRPRSDLAYVVLTRRHLPIGPRTAKNPLPST